MGDDGFQSVIDRYVREEISAPIAVMELLLHTADAESVVRTLRTLQGNPPASDMLASDTAKLQELERLATEHTQGCRAIAEILRTGLDSPEPASSVDDGIERARRLFDDGVRRNEEASVALYSLGSPAILERATNEVIDVLEDWGVLGVDRDALEIGCGIGRFLVPLASRLRSLVGVDVSSEMIAAATRRLGDARNVRVRVTEGRDLGAFAARSLDLVYSVDAFPYLVLAGRALVEAHLRDAMRVLRPGGDVVIFNYAYGRSRHQNAQEFRALAEKDGFQVLRSDATPFRIWNGVGYHVRKRAF